MRIRYGESPWITEFPDSRRPKYPRISSDLKADVVVIGGGLTGCTTAYACATAGLSVILLESNRIGQGSAGRSAGLLLPEPGLAFREIVGAHGLRTARRVFDAWKQGSVDAANLIRRNGITCGLEVPHLLLVANRDTEKDLRREFDAREGADLDAKWLNQKQVKALSALEASGAIRTRAAMLDPYRACVGLAGAAVRRRAKLFERSRVLKVRFSRKDVEVVTTSGNIRARKAIITTGTATTEFRQLRRHFKRRESYVVLTEPVPTSVRKQLGRRGVVIEDARTPHRRVRWTPDHRILVAGADQDEVPERNRSAVLTQRTGQLMYELLTMYPVISGLQPASGWHVGYGETADGLMYIGAHRNYPHHLFALGGGSGSVTGAFVAARILVRAVQDAAEKSDDVFSWVR